MKTKILFILISVALLLSTLFLIFHDSFQGQLLRFGIRMDVHDMKITDRYAESSGRNNINWIVAKSVDKILFLGRVYTENPGKYIQDKTYLLLGLYDSSKSPYPEVITNTVDCPADLKPMKQDFGTDVVYKLFANERFGYGICAEDLITYNSFYGLFDCGKKGVFEVKIFSHKSAVEAERLMRSFRCD